MGKRPQPGSRVSFFLDDPLGRTLGIAPFTGQATGTVQGSTRLRGHDGSSRIHLEIALDSAFWPQHPHPGFPEEGHTCYVLPEQVAILAAPVPQASEQTRILGPMGG